MQHADRVMKVEPLAEPFRDRRPRIDVNSFRVVSRAENLDGICGHARRHWD